MKYSSIDYNKYFETNVIDGTPVEIISLGTLALPTGKIIACDPLVYLFGSFPFSRTVEPGKYPVIVYIAKTESSGDRYALVKLEFTKTKPIKWEMAFSDNDNIAELGADEFVGFPVDAGLGCFCDVKT